MIKFESWEDLLQQHRTSKEGVVDMPPRFTVKDSSRTPDAAPGWLRRLPKTDGIGVYEYSPRSGCFALMEGLGSDAWVQAEHKRIVALPHELQRLEIREHRSSPVLLKCAMSAAEPEFRREVAGRIPPRDWRHFDWAELPSDILAIAVLKASPDLLKEIPAGRNSQELRVMVARRASQKQLQGMAQDSARRVRAAVFYNLEDERVRCQMFRDEIHTDLRTEMAAHLPLEFVSEFRATGNQALRAVITERLTGEKLKAQLGDTAWKVREIAIGKLPLEDLVSHSDVEVACQQALTSRFRDYYLEQEKQKRVLEEEVLARVQALRHRVPKPSRHANPCVEIVSDHPPLTHPSGIEEDLQRVEGALDEVPKALEKKLEEGLGEAPGPELSSTLVSSVLAAVLDRATGSTAASLLTTSGRDQLVDVLVQKGLML